MDSRKYTCPDGGIRTPITEEIIMSKHETYKTSNFSYLLNLLAGDEGFEPHINILPSSFKDSLHTSLRTVIINLIYYLLSNVIRFWPFMSFCQIFSGFKINPL